MSRPSEAIATEIADLLLERELRPTIVENGSGKQGATSPWGQLYQLLLEYEQQRTREMITPPDDKHSPDCTGSSYPCSHCRDSDNQLRAAQR